MWGNGHRHGDCTTVLKVFSVREIEQNSVEVLIQSAIKSGIFIY